MRFSSPRKITRFYVINPITDRRIEQRFDSRESVVVKLEQGGKVFPAFGCDIGRYGLKLESPLDVGMGNYVQVSFPNTPDQVQCFGRVVWSHPVKESGQFECGLSIEAWHGIVHGEHSWKKYKGGTPKSDRRLKIR